MKGLSDNRCVTKVVVKAAVPAAKTQVRQSQNWGLTSTDAAVPAIDQNSDLNFGDAFGSVGFARISPIGFRGASQRNKQHILLRPGPHLTRCNRCLRPRRSTVGSEMFRFLIIKIPFVFAPR